MQNKVWENVLTWVLAIALFGSGGYYFIQRNKANSTASNYDMKQIAATADDVEILEADISRFIDSMRTDTSTGAMTSGADWAKMLKKGGETPSTLRENVIKNYFGLPILVLNDAAELGIYPDYEAIDLRIAEQHEVFDASSNWAGYLNYMGFASDDAYRRFLGAQDVVDAFLKAKFADPEPTEEEINDYLKKYAPYMSGRRSSAVVIDVDEDTSYSAALQQANTALNQINRGVNFGDVSDQYSQTAIPLEPGGDMGWESLTNMPTEYYDALGTLQVGEISGIVESGSYIFIIYCTDEYTYVEEGFDPASMPQDMRDIILETLPDQLAEERPTKYFESLSESDRIVINPMPTGLAYDVDMALALPDLSELETTDEIIGTGVEVKEGDTVRVTYKGTLDDGTVFDASYLHEPGYLEFVVGEGSMIPGFDYGVIGMNVGGKRILHIPPALAYGADGNSSVPPNSWLKFEIEMISVNGDSTGAEDILIRTPTNFDPATGTDTGAGDGGGAGDSGAGGVDTGTGGVDTSGTGDSGTGTDVAN